MGLSLSWRYRVRFEGGGEYVSSDVRSNPSWGDEVFRSPIRSMEFILPVGTVLLSGMEQYNFSIEIVEALAGGSSRAFMVLGKRPGVALVDVWKVAQGRISSKHVVWGREWLGNPIRGWKSGFPSGVIISRFARP